MHLYNTLTGKKEFLKNTNEIVKFYACGPTVYGAPHIGNARASFVADFLRKSLEFLGYEVKFVSNFTDIDDKMIETAKKRKISVGELASEMSDVATKSFKALRIDEPNVRPYATEYVEKMIVLVKSLLEKEIAYMIDGDGVYFRVDKFEDYGKLSKQNLDELKIGERINENMEKENPRDFVLWKFKKEGEPSWVDSAGIVPEGRPGWHLECSVMIEETLGGTIDIHAGGLDLKFPHHECEIAQSEVLTGKPLSRFWVHNGFVNMDGEKMSKSLGNIKSVIDLIKVYDPLDIRYFLMSVHYRSPIDFTVSNLKQASESRARLQNLWDRLNSDDIGENKCDDAILKTFKGKVMESLADDLNVSEVLAVLFDLTTVLNVEIDKEMFDKDSLELIKDAILEVDKVLGIIRYEIGELNDVQGDLFEKRINAREDKDYELSDKLRDELFELGVQVMDSKDGSSYRLI